jgi:hypothetical protein
MSILYAVGRLADKAVEATQTVTWRMLVVMEGNKLMRCIFLPGSKHFRGLDLPKARCFQIREPSEAYQIAGGLVTFAMRMPETVWHPARSRSFRVSVVRNKLGGASLTIGAVIPRSTQVLVAGGQSIHCYGCSGYRTSPVGV